MPKTIDPIYKQYASKVIKNIASTEFYEYFMNALGSGKNVFQFSNRKIEKTVDERWVKEIEAVIKPMQEIINNPRNFIQQEEVIVNVALAKKVTPDTVRHLAQHGNMIDEVTEDSVRPNKLMEKFKEDSWNTYENKFVYTLLEMTWDFVDKRYEAIFAAMGEEQGAYLKLSSDTRTYQEHWSVNLDIRVNQEEDLLSSDEKNESIFARIARLHRLLNTFRSTPFAKTVAKYGKIKPPLVRTNAIAKNPNFKACHKLWNFILAYNDVGYSINVYEQNPEITPDFQQDIFNSILFDYIILKNYLTLAGDKNIDMTEKFKKRTLKPKYIKEIVEEITKNYDLPDVEIRKVLIEELTKAQLMQEEEAERLRLVEAKEKEMAEKRKQEEKERKAKEKAELRERMRQQREAEKEQQRLEKERLAQEAREKKEAERIAAEEQRTIDSFLKELETVFARRKQLVEDRAEAAELEKARLEEEEYFRQAREKEELEKQKEKERLLKEKEKAKAKAAAEKEKERAKAKAEAEKEKAKQKAAAEKEKAKQKAEAEKQKAKAKAEAEKQKEKERLLKEKQKEKERLAKEKAKEKERAAKEKAKAKAAPSSAAGESDKENIVTENIIDETPEIPVNEIPAEVLPAPVDQAPEIPLAEVTPAEEISASEPEPAGEEYAASPEPAPEEPVPAAEPAAPEPDPASDQPEPEQDSGKKSFRKFLGNLFSGK